MARLLTLAASAALLALAADAAAELEGAEGTVVDDVTAVAGTTWKWLSCGVQGWKQKYLTMAGGSGPTSTAVFNFALAQGGCYLVEEFHPRDDCNQAFSSEVRLEVHHGQGMVEKVVVDQTLRGNQWNSVALLPFAGGSSVQVHVAHPQKAGTVSVADAFRFTRVAAACGTAAPTLDQYQKLQQHPVSVMLDDAGADKTGLPMTGKCEATALLGTAHVVADGAASAVFHFVPPSTGCYRVEEFHPRASEKCPLDASTSVRVDYCAGRHWTGDVPLSQGGGQWNAFGHWPFYAGRPGKLTATRQAGPSGGAHWAADAARFTKVAEGCGKVPFSAPVTLRLVGAELPTPLSSGSVSHAKLRLALQALVADAVGLDKDAVRLLGLRKGSVVADYEFAGTKDDVSAAVVKLQAALASGLSSSLCAAAGADGCSVELVSTTAPPPKSGEDSSSSLLLNLAAGCAAVALLALLVVIGCFMRRRRNPDGGKDVDRDVAGNVASRGTVDLPAEADGVIVEKDVEMSLEKEPSEQGSTAAPTESSEPSSSEQSLAQTGGVVPAPPSAASAGQADSMLL